jgi:gliding motility-associated-like protein
MVLKYAHIPLLNKLRKFATNASVLYKRNMILSILILYALIAQAQSDSTFKKAFITDKDMIPVSIESVKSGGFIVGGLERSQNEREWSGFMLKLTEKGECEWKRSLFSDTSGNFQQVKPLKDGSFIGVNNYLRDRAVSTGLFTGAALTWCKMDANGTIQWAKGIGEGQLSNPPAIDIELADDGSIYTLGYFQQRVQVDKKDSPAKAGITKLGANGNIAIDPFELTIAPLVYFDVSDLYLNDDKDIMVFGSANSPTYSNVNRGVVVTLKDLGNRFINKTTKAYSSSSIDINFKKAFKTSDGGAIISGIGVPNKHLLVKLDKDGNVQWSKSFSTGTKTYNPKDAIQTQDKGIILTGYEKSNTLLFKVSESGTLLWAKDINAEALSIGLLAETQKGNIIAIGNGYRFDNTNERGIDLYISLFDKEGIPNSCTHKNANLIVENVNISAQTLSTEYREYPFLTFGNHILESNIKSVATKPICKCLTVGYLDTFFCRGGSIKIAGKTYDKNILDTLLLRNQFGCDSLLFLTVSSVFPSEKTIEKTICKGDAYKFNNQTLTVAGKYEAKYTNKFGCDSTVTLELTIKDTVTENIEKSICEGESYSFFNKNLTKSGIYTEKTALPSGCDNKVVLTLKVNPKPIIQSNNEQIVDMNWGDTLKLNACGEGIKYEWTPQNILTCANCDTPSVFAKENAIVKAKIFNQTGCFSECNFNVQVKRNALRLKSFDIPNIFSPNNDGNNDFFEIKSTKIKLKSFEIYNRWGNLIFKDTNENAKWDGYVNGKMMLPDVYVYLIRFIRLETQQEETIFGDVTLVR